MLETLVSTRYHVERVESCRDVTSQVEFGPIFGPIYSKTLIIITLSLKLTVHPIDHDLRNTTRRCRQLHACRGAMTILLFTTSYEHLATWINISP